MKYALVILFFTACNVTSKVPLSHGESYEGRRQYYEGMGNHYKSIADTTKKYEKRIRAHRSASIYYEQAANNAVALTRILIEEYKLKTEHGKDNP